MVSLSDGVDDGREHGVQCLSEIPRSGVEGGETRRRKRGGGQKEKKDANNKIG